jgi:hypothetical protein
VVFEYGRLNCWKPVGQPRNLGITYAVIRSVGPFHAFPRPDHAFLPLVGKNLSGRHFVKGPGSSPDLRPLAPSGRSQGLMLGVVSRPSDLAIFPWRFPVPPVIHWDFLGLWILWIQS